MTVAEVLLRKAKEKREMAQNLYDDIEELEGEFLGMEFEYEGNYVCIQFIDIMGDQVILYGEGPEGEWDKHITLEELAELF